ncbi:hypothetical protein ACFU8I_33515 [Streptomyces sp. NPDC057540]|uniref:hypothetical protein n=1 Tax=Streptomyces sp. NPDC057540 TaxID=3346160 RepID=UPI0036D1077D
MSDEPQTEAPMIAALLREREGLKQRGLDDRVKQVDEQLKHHGYKPRRTSAKDPAATTPPAPATPPGGDGPKDPAPATPPAGAAPKGRQQQAPATT